MSIITKCRSMRGPGPQHSRFSLTGNRSWLAGLVLLLSSLGARAQLAGGTYTINPNGAGATNFTSFTAAVTALNVAGGTGDVTFLVSPAAPGAYAENVPAITAAAGGSSTRTITFREATLTATLADNPVIEAPGSGAATDAGITLASADYVTFDGINITGSATGTVEYGFLVQNAATDGAQYNTIRNARIVLNRGNTASVGVLQTASSTGGGANANGSVGINRNNVYENLTIENAYKGIHLLTGNASGVFYDEQNVVRNCTVGAGIATAATGSIGNNVATITAGIQVTRQNAFQVYNNEVQNVVVAASTAYGVFVEAAFGTGNLLYGNRIHDIRNTSGTGTVYGMRLDVVAAAAAGGVTGHTVTAYNNFIYGLTNAFTGTASATMRTIGIGTNITSSTLAGSFINVYYNSVRMENLAGYTASSAAFSQNGTTTTPQLTLRNNIFADFSPAQTGAAKHVAIDAAATAQFGGAGSTSNYNDLFVANMAANEGGYVGLTLSTNRLTLADWQGAVNQDAQSKSVDPSFTSATDLHSSAAALNNAGVPAAAITTVDIDGDVRGTGMAGSGTAPDIGADEFAPASNDVEVVSISSPAVPAPTGNNTVRVVVRNNGGVPLTQVRLEYVLNGGAPVGQVFTGLNVAVGQTTTLDFTVPASLVAGSNTITVTGSLPNNTADPTSGNNTTSTTVYAALAGVYTINKLLPTGGTNFISFADASAALASGGISASVRFNVLNGPYTEQFTLGPTAGTSPTDTIVVDGGAGKQALNFTSTASAQRAAVVLNGAQYVTLTNLTIDASAGTTYGIGVVLVGQAHFNRISNSVITAHSSTTAANAAGIAISGSAASATTAGAATNLSVENNTISSGYYGIIMTGTATNTMSGHRIIGNTIRDFHGYGIDVEFSDGAILSQNDISRPARTTTATTSGGIFIGSATLNALVERNRIHNLFGGQTASTSASAGIFFSSADGTAGNSNQVFNNLIYNFTGQGIQYGIQNTGSNYGQYYHNTITLDNTASTATGVTYGFYQTTQADGVDFRNNIVRVTRGGSGNRVALFFNAPTSNIVSDYNDLYIGTGGNFYTGSANGALQVTLDEWKAANGNLYDQHSVQVDPSFVGTTLVPSSAALNGAGEAIFITPGVLLVARDFANVARNNPPDIGAYEFTPPPADVALTAFVAPVPPQSAGASTPITVTVQNNGGSTLTQLTLTYTFNGGSPVSQTIGMLSIAAGSSGPVSFTAPITIAAGTNTLEVVATLPNGSADAAPGDNTLTTTFNPALSGTYTINNQAAASATNFPSFTAAAAALNGGGIIGGPVYFNVLNGPYTEQITLNEIAGVSATDTIVFNGNGRTIRFGSTNPNQRAVIKLDGADYVTFDNLVIDATNNGGSPTYGWGVHLINSADHNRISDSELRLNETSTSTANFSGIVGSASNTATTTAGNTANFLWLENNLINGGGYGILINGPSAATRNRDIRIVGNEVRNFHSYGISVENFDGVRVINNNIHRTTRSVVGVFYGIHQSGNINADLERNRIHDTFTGNPAANFVSYGLYSTTNDAAAGSENDAVNNVIYNFNGINTEYGIYNIGSDYARYYHNTISLDNTAAVTTSATAGFYQTTSATGIEFLNNVVSVRRNPTGAGNKNALHFATVASSIYSDYNDLYVGTGTDFFTGTYGSAGQATLADWQAVNMTSYDQNSVQANPFFVDAAAGNLRPAAAALNAAGVALARVTTDVTGAARPTPPATRPDLGAYEFTPPAEDVALTAIVAPVTGAPSGANTVTVTVSNNGLSDLTEVTLAYSVNSGAPETQLFTGLSIASGASQNLSFTAPATLLAGSNQVSATVSLPNGNVDGDASNNTLTITVNTPLAGVYTIDKAQPTSATNFVSFTAAAAALNVAGVSAPVRFNVLNGPYTEQFSLGEIAGVTDADTIVVDGGAGKQRLTFTATSSQPAAVVLAGSDFVTLTNLTIDMAAGTTYGVGVLLTGTATNNRVSNSVIMAPAAATGSTTNAGISATGTTTSVPTDLRIENNVISGGYYSVALNGTSTGTATGARIVGNELKDFYTYGVYLTYASGAQVLGNDIHRATRAASTTVSSFYGVSAANSSGLDVERNRIHSPFQNFAANTGTAYGVSFGTNPTTAAAPNHVVNNVIYDFDGAGIEYGLYNFNSPFTRYYHNSVSLDNQANAGDDVSYGYYQNGQTDGLEFFNNVVSVTRTGTGNRVAIYLSAAFTTASPVLVSDYNDLYIGTGPNFYTGFYTSANSYRTLANWQTANVNSYDQNSVQVRPDFEAPLAGNLKPGASPLNSAGTAATLARVPKDVLGLPRSSPPDMGAFEFTPVSTDLTPTALATPLASQACPTSTESVSVMVRNQGLSPLDFAANPATVTVNVSGATTAALTGSIASGTLAPGATRTVVLTPALDMSALGTYTFAITATVAGDQNPGNDVLAPSPTITVLAPVAGTFSLTSSTACTGSSTTLALTGAANGDIQYQQSTDNVTFTDITGANSATYVSGPLTQTTYFRAQTRCNGRVATSPVRTVTVSDPQPVSTNAPRTICSGASTTLTVTGTTGQTFQFFDSAMGGSALPATTGGTAGSPTASYTTPALAASTTYYVQSTKLSNATVGKTPNTGTGTANNANAGLVFDVASATTLQSVTVYSAGATGPITIQLRNAAGSPLGGTANASNTVTTTINPGTAGNPVATVVPLNFPLPVGDNYRLVQASNVDLVREITSGFTYPYVASDNSVTIKSAFLTSPSPSYYYFFYDWRLSSTCTGTRTALQVNVATPTVSATATDVSSGGAADGSITATGAAGTAPYQYSLDGGTSYLPATPTAAAYTFTGLTAGAYTVTVRDANGCTGTTGATVGTALGDLVVSTNNPNVSGTYNNVTVTSAGIATLSGTLSVNGTLLVQSGGVLNTNCQLVDGPGAFTLNAGATLSICNPAGISASGNTGAVQVAGARSFSTDASYLYNGSVAQVTGSGLPGQVRNLVLDNPAGLSLSQAVGVAQVATLTNGNLATAGHAFTLLSSAAGTALVVNTNGVVTGTATVQRYIDPSLNPGLGYRHYSAPVTGSTVADLTTPGFTPVVNPAYNSAAAPGGVSPFPTVYGYDEARLRPAANGGSPALGGTEFDKGWFSPGALSSPLLVGQGYTVNIGASQVVDFNGTLVNGDQNLTGLTRGAQAEAGWQFLGNPFPAPIDWNLMTPADFTNVDAAVYLYKSTGRYVGGYTSFVNGVGVEQEIAIAQGFFVRTDLPGTGALRLRNAIRKTTFSAAPTFQRTASGTRPLVQLELNGATATDAAYVYFEQGATAPADGRYDAVKLPNTHGLNLSSAVAGTNLAINGLPLLGSQATVVPLHVATPQAGTYTFRVAELVNFAPGTAVELRDALTGTVTTLQAGTSYRCTLPVGASGPRFSLVFRPAAVTGSQLALNAALVSLFPNPAHGRFTLQVPPVSGLAKVQATLLNSLGQVVLVRALAMTAAGATADFDTSSLAAGVYSLQVRAGGLLVTKRVVLE